MSHASQIGNEVPNRGNSRIETIERAFEDIAGYAIRHGVGLSKVITKVDERIIHAKAIRRISDYLGFSVGDAELTALGCVSTWCLIKMREGGPISSIVDWSGYTINWKKKVRHGIHRCIALGALEFVKVNGGNRLCITTKGHRILDVYDMYYQVVLNEIDQAILKGRQEKQEKQAKRALIRELRQAV